jgi:transposase
MRRYGLRDDQWDRIKDLLPGREGHVGVTAKDNRLFIEAVLYRYRAWIPWRDLPERFGDWKAVHSRRRSYDRDLSKERHLVENFFCLLKQFRAIATRYDRRAANFLAGVYAAACLILLN